MPQKKETILKEIERGEKSLKAAQLLYENALYEDAISRAYYAVLHLAKAAILYYRTSELVRDQINSPSRIYYNLI